MKLVPDLDERLSLGVAPGQAGRFQFVGPKAPLLSSIDRPIRHHAAIGQGVKIGAVVLADAKESWPATALGDLTGRRNPELLACGSGLTRSLASSSFANSMESLPWTLRTRDPSRVRFRVRSSLTGETSKHTRLSGVPESVRCFLSTDYSMARLRHEFYDTIHGFQMFTEIS